MTRLLLIFWLLIAGPVLAAPVRVTSGEHEGFTRLVLDFGTAVNWELGRNDDGYELRLAGSAQTYDLRQAFDLIGKSRLAAIWVTPSSGALHVGLACACHAIPFEFRPGIVVIDLKDGPPPKGSAFELALDGAEATPIAAHPVAKPRARPQQAESLASYNWVALAYKQLHPDDRQSPVATNNDRPGILPPDPALQPLRDTLLHQMARGVAQGVVEMALPATPAKAPASDFPLAQIRIGDQPGDLLAKDSAVKPDLTAKGATCIAPEDLDIAAWGDVTRPVIDQIADAKIGLTGEFDRPDPAAVARAAKFQLFLGFGVEARQTLSAFAINNRETPIWTALSFLVDERPDPAHLFQGMTACEGSAALWAMLEDPAPMRGDPIAKGAVRLAFSALPLHLRRQLGPRIAERFLAVGDAETARALQDAILRAPGETASGIALMGVELDLHKGDAATAEKNAAAVLADPGPNTPEALITLTEARVAQNLPISTEVVVALQSLQSEFEGSTLAPRLANALVLARAASGDFVAAFDGLETFPDSAAQVWELMAILATDEDFLAHAVLAPDAPEPRVKDSLRQDIARRLLGLGLADPAQRWLDAIENPDPILAAQIALGRGDGHHALAALAQKTGDEAQELTLLALDLIGQDEARAKILAASEIPEAAAPALARAGKWPALETSEAKVWAELASRLAPSPANQPETSQPTGPLAHGHDLIAAGGETRAAVTALLANIPMPNLP